MIFAAGTGNPFFTTDTAAALRASEMGCDALLKATKVDGVYDADPNRVPSAVRFDRLSYLDVLSRDLQVMDASAISLARENRIPILVFSIFESGGFAEVLRGRGRYTIIERPRLEAATGKEGHAGRLIADGSAAPHGWRDRGVAQGIRRVAHRPRIGEPARAGHRRRLWRHHADQPGRQCQRAGAADDHGAGVGPRRWSRRSTRRSGKPGWASIRRRRAR